MTKRPRRRYTAEFKAAAVARLDEAGETLSSVAQALGVTVTQVRIWRLEQQASGAAEAVARRKAEAAELQQLRRENKRLQEENEILRKASAFFAIFRQMGGETMNAKLAFISAHSSTYSIRRLCAVLGMARSWFYDWRAEADIRAAGQRAEAALVGQIQSICQDSGSRYGAPRIHAELQARGVRIARKRVARLMRENSLRPLRRKKRPPITTDSRHGYGVAPNLLERAFTGNHPNAIWLADITYVATDEGWLYLAAVKDLATREIVGWSMADHLKSSLCESALMMAIHHRAPPVGLIHHSDRGVQYACGSYRKILDRYGFQASMSRKGDCYDNAPMESFFGSLKTELVHLTRFRTRREAKAALFEYLEIFYNRRRRHSGIGYRTPAQAYAEMLMKAAA